MITYREQLMVEDVAHQAHQRLLDACAQDRRCRSIFMRKNKVSEENQSTPVFKGKLAYAVAVVILLSLLLVQTVVAAINAFGGSGGGGINLVR
jgi:uncharacterized protein involved in tolerance to divalent cations